MVVLTDNLKIGSVRMLEAGKMEAALVIEVEEFCAQIAVEGLKEREPALIEKLLVVEDKAGLKGTRRGLSPR